jgi:flagella basal body P-ring formation protein FlgA
MKALPASLFCAAAFTAGAAHAQAPGMDEGTLRNFVSQQVAASGAQLTRFDVQVGTVEPRTPLAACQRTEPFMPTGARLWGRSSVGLRCVEGANWTLMIPVSVRAWGNALVAAVPMAAGSVAAADDVREQEVEISREPAGLLRDPAQVQGRTLNRAVAAGQPLRADMFRLTQAVAAGDPVRLRVQGNGYALTAAGQALTAAADGQTIRVRSDFGKILTGVAREGRIVDLQP